MHRCKLILVLLASILAITVRASVPQLISYQGRLTGSSGQALSDGTISVQFSIYDVPVNGAPLWTETNSNVQVKGGLFSTMLGSVQSLPSTIFDGTSRWFGVKVGTDPEMAPRQQVASSAYAFRSGVASTVDDGAIGTPKIASAAVTAEKLAPGVALPPGGVIMWSGAADKIPTGWALCNGQSGTPDLRDRFIVGAGGEYAVGATGGEKLHLLTVAEMPSHSHGIKAAFGDSGYAWVGHTGTNNGGSLNHPGTLNAGGDQPHENRPPYYALCFIMKLGY